MQGHDTNSGLTLDALELGVLVLMHALTLGSFEGRFLVSGRVTQLFYQNVNEKSRREVADYRDWSFS